MSSKHVTKKFPEWQEGSLTPSEKKTVDEHLNVCRECREYYDTWQGILESPDMSGLSQLEPDPYLATRIMAGELAAKTETQKDPAFQGIRWSFATLLLFIGLSFGVILGLSGNKPAENTDQEIATAYYQAFTQQENQYDLEKLLGLENGGEHEN
jgi:predicted anti-sigma-YlaC factor YlaD